MANEFSGDAGFEWNRGNCKRMMPLISITVFVGVRFCEVSGAIEPRVFPSFKAAMEWCYCTHNLAVDKWEAFLDTSVPQMDRFGCVKAGRRSGCGTSVGSKG
jgi:hypothetical protein